MSVPPPVNVVSEDAEERSMAALAHASILLNFFVPGLGVIAAFAVWLVQRDRSAYASKQALQAGIYQIAWAVAPMVIAIMGIIALVSGVLVAALANSTLGVAVLVPILIFGVLIMLAIFFIGLIYGLVAAYETYQGRDFRYWLIGRLVR